MIVADAATIVILLVIVVLACVSVFTLVFIVVAICNLAIIGVRELAYRRRRRRRAEALYGPERR
jgi:hypothetical protein